MKDERRVKWVKAANAWCVTTYEFDKKKNRLVNRVEWHTENPDVKTRDA